MFATYFARSLLAFKTSVIRRNQINSLLPFSVSRLLVTKCFLHSASTSFSSAKIKQVIPESNSIWLKVIFSDGSSQKFPKAWLRDSCKCSKCWDTVHSFRLTNSWIPDVSIKAEDIIVNSEGELEISWLENDDYPHKSVYNPKWLQQSGKSMSEKKLKVTRDVTQRPMIRLWTKADVDSDGLPSVDFEAFMKERQAVKLWLQLFYQWGFVVLKNSPLTEDSITDFASRLSFIRESSFGRVSDVCIGPESGLHPAYTGLAINFHTDLTYKERSPGILSLHCIKNSNPSIGEAGGQTWLTDGIQAAKWIREHNTTAFHILSTVPIPYRYRDPTRGINYTAYWPVIGLDPLGEVQEIHFSNFARETLNFDPDLLVPLYSALKIFGDRLVDPETRAEFYLKPGDILTINNRRVLHARTEFDANKVERHLRTIYMDLDEVLGFYDTLLNGDK